MNIPALKIIDAIRDKSIVPEIKPSKVIELAEKLNRARRTKFATLVAANPINQEGDQ